MSYSPETLRAVLESMQHTIMGRCARPAEVRYMDSGKSVAKVRIAVNNGRDEEPHWFTVEAWDQLAQQLADDCDKGTMLKVTGRVVENHWQTKTGEQRVDMIIKAQSLEAMNDRQPALQMAKREYAEAMPF